MESTDVKNLPEAQEQELLSIKNLNVIVHPSHLIGNPNTKFLFPGKPNWESYKPASKKIQGIMLNKFSVQNRGDVSLVMPHIKPNLAEFRRIKEVRKQDDTDTDLWIDIYRKLRENSQFPENIIVVDNLAEYSFRKTEEEWLAKVQADIVDKLKEKGLVINDNTLITISGEFTDVCVDESMRKLMLLSQINSIRIDKSAGVSTAYQYTDPSSVLKKDQERLQKYVEGLEKDFNILEDEDYVYVSKKSRDHID